MIEVLNLIPKAGKNFWSLINTPSKRAISFPPGNLKFMNSVSKNIKCYLICMYDKHCINIKVKGGWWSFWKWSNQKIFSFIKLKFQTVMLHITYWHIDRIPLFYFNSPFAEAYFCNLKWEWKCAFTWHDKNRLKKKLNKTAQPLLPEPLLITLIWPVPPKLYRQKMNIIHLGIPCPLFSPNWLTV